MTTIHSQHNLKELTLRGILLGMVITAIFTASNVYLGLKVGLTFSSAIPAAVISMAILRFLAGSNILENNLVQTQASAAGTLSAIIFVLPGILMIGYWQGFELWQTFIICACGGCLGILFTIPLRRAMVVNSSLPYPEGVAAAEILKIGNAKESKSKEMKEILIGTSIASFITLCSNGFKVLSSEVSFWFHIGGSVSQIPLGFSTALLGAGYLIGLASGIAMLIGTLIAWGVFVPYYTHGIAWIDLEQIGSEIWSSKVRFIGAGMIGIAAIWTLISLLKPVLDGLKISMQAFKNQTRNAPMQTTDQDIPVQYALLLGILIILGLSYVFYSFIATVFDGSLLWVYVVVSVCVSISIGFFVSAACGYMAGLIGSSSSPISGIGILGIIISSLVMIGVSHLIDGFSFQKGSMFATALAIFITSAIVSIACIANDNLQDLKTGYIIGATPWKQQTVLIIGCIAGSLVITPVLNLLYEAYGFTGAMPRENMDVTQTLSAPQATLMTHIAQGIFSDTLEWDYILIGIILGAIIIVIDILLKKSTTWSLPPLAVGMGIYLPPTLQTPLVIGAIMGHYIMHHIKQKYHANESEQQKNKGLLFASGLIVGESLVGVFIACVIVISMGVSGVDSPLVIAGDDFIPVANILGLITFIGVITLFIYRTVYKR